MGKAATYGFEFICFLLENPIGALALPLPLALSGMYLLGKSLLWLPVFYVLCVVAPLLLFIATLVLLSWSHDSGPANWEEFLTIHDASVAAGFAGRKIPIETAVELYMNGKLDMKKDVLETFMHRNRLFRFTITVNHVKYFCLELMRQMTGHSQNQDHQEVGDVYNRGNDFYSWFLGETMIYTSGMFRSSEEDLTTAQNRKLDTIAQYIQLKEGEEHLDIGCGWGTLVSHFAKNYKSNSTGCTLAKEQVVWGKETAAKYGAADRVNFLCCDYREIPKQTNNKKYNKITCLEMAEHVGIKNFQRFLNQVDDMLADDGLFYLQIAGLRRKWQWEDLVWGMFMGKYIFPGADASCPLNFVVNQLERAGFEVHRVENMGVHYARTIEIWYENWRGNEDKVVAKYGKWWFRLWMIFLAWSTMIARQGSSTVFMITCNKNICNDEFSTAQPKQDGAVFNRTTAWIGDKPVASQQ